MAKYVGLARLHTPTGNTFSLSSTRGTILHYAIDPRLSRFNVQAFAGGFLAALGHSPRFAIRGLSAEARLDPEDFSSGSLRMEIQADSLQLLGPGLSMSRVCAGA